MTPEIQEAIEWLREWAREGFPRRGDGSFPPDFITAMRRLTNVTPEQMDYRNFELALCAGPDFDFQRPSPYWSWDATKHWKAVLSES